MDGNTQKDRKPRKNGMETIVANATILYLVFFFLGALIHYFYPVPIDLGGMTPLIGLILVMGGPLLILWSQVSIRRFKKEAATQVSTGLFSVGPYRFSRNPTYLGLTLLISGFGFFANSLSIALSAIAAFAAVNFIIVRKEESALEEKFGETYREYKGKVRRWL